MIYFYSGTPGSGKSLSMAKQVEFWLKVLGKNVIANVHINRNKILKNEKLHAIQLPLFCKRQNPNFGGCCRLQRNGDSIALF